MGASYLRTPASARLALLDRDFVPEIFCDKRYRAVAAAAEDAQLWGAARFLSVNSSQPEFPWHLQRKRRRHHSPAVRQFFALGEVLRRQVEAEQKQRMGVRPRDSN